jgi:hypothetical protein
MLKLYSYIFALLTRLRQKIDASALLARQQGSMLSMIRLTCGGPGLFILHRQENHSSGSPDDLCSVQKKESAGDRGH